MVVFAIFITTFNWDEKKIPMMSIEPNTSNSKSVVLCVYERRLR